MKAQELMMGDWVMKTDVDGNPVAPYQIDWIRTGEVGLLWNVITTPPLITPIPLTAEILEKNGFAYNDMPFLQLWENGIRIYENDGAHRTLAIQTNGFASMQYVHQCQHALRLCGLNELADNFQVE